jgi:hypothetical protein
MDLYEIYIYAHNSLGPQGPFAPDDPKLDSDGPDGRATIDHMWQTYRFDCGDRAYAANFHPGDLRIKKTESLTKNLLSDFQNYVRTHSNSSSKCWEAFIGGN